MNTIELYNKICQQLTWYENPKEDGFNRTASEIAEDMYDTLCQVQEWMLENGFDGLLVENTL